MELRAVKFAALICDYRKGRAVAGGDNLKAGRELRDFVTVAHPNLMPLTLFPEAVEQSAILGHGQKGAAKFAAFPRFVAGPHLSAELVAHDLLAITNAKDRDAGFEKALRAARRSVLGDAGG